MDNVVIPICWAGAHEDFGLVLHGRSDGSVGVGDCEAEGHDRSKQDGNVEQRSIAKSTGPVLGEDSHDDGMLVRVLTINRLL